jgi:hypothetical protein
MAPFLLALPRGSTLPCASLCVCCVLFGASATRRQPRARLVANPVRSSSFLQCHLGCWPESGQGSPGQKWVLGDRRVDYGISHGNDFSSSSSVLITPNVDGYGLGRLNFTSFPPSLFSTSSPSLTVCSNVGNSLIEWLAANINVTGNQYLTSLSLYFVGHVLFEAPANVALKRTAPQLWLPALTNDARTHNPDANVRKRAFGILCSTCLPSLSPAHLLPYPSSGQRSLHISCQPFTHCFSMEGHSLFQMPPEAGSGHRGKPPCRIYCPAFCPRPSQIQSVVS